MSESEAHRVLIRQIAAALKKRFSDAVFIADLQQTPGNEVPPSIGGFRPDAYGEDSSSGKILIAEAKVETKPGRVFESQHTHSQIAAFIQHLEMHPGENYFVLSAKGLSSDYAKSFLHIVCLGLGVEKTAVEVFDGNDFWSLDLRGGGKWHLI